MFIPIANIFMLDNEVPTISERSDCLPKKAKRRHPGGGGLNDGTNGQKSLEKTI